MAFCHIVFLPGLFAQGWIWKTVATEYKNSDCSVTVIDPSIPEAFGGKLENAHTVIQDCLDSKSGSGPVILVGNSMSGLIAMDFASHYPDTVQGLVVSGSPGLDEIEAGVALTELRKGCPDSAEALGNRVLYSRNNISEKNYMKGVFDIQKVFSSADTFKYIIKWLNISRKYNVLNSLSNIKCPIQLLWGDHDLITPGVPWMELAKKHRSITYREVEKCGHSPMLEKPYEFIELMNAYLIKINEALTQEV